MPKDSANGTEEKIQKLQNPRCIRLHNRENLCHWAVSRMVNQRLGLVITRFRPEGKKDQSMLYYFLHSFIRCFSIVPRHNKLAVGTREKLMIVCLIFLL